MLNTSLVATATITISGRNAENAATITNQIGRWKVRFIRGPVSGQKSLSFEFASRGEGDMREIKFRQPITNKAGKFITWAYWGFMDGRFVHPAGYADGRADPDSQQFTGVKDRNDIEIYEGDVFDCVYKSDGCKHRSLVVYDAPGFMLKYIGKCQQTGVYQRISDGARYGVIGNIYENPELTEPTK